MKHIVVVMGLLSDGSGSHWFVMPKAYDRLAECKEIAALMTVPREFTIEGKRLRSTTAGCASMDADYASGLAMFLNRPAAR